MPTATPLRAIAVLAMVLTITGCGFTSLGEGRPGGRHWVITVDNQSSDPVRLFVAEDRQPMGAQVGRVMPDTVPASTVVEVAFDVPPPGSWAIFANPSPQRGPLFMGSEIPPTATGKLPIKIIIDPNGEPGTEVPNLPGWFGN